MDSRKVYAHRFSDADRLRKEAIWRVIVRRFFQKWVQPTDVVLDIGCGFGEFLGAIRCGRKIGLDMNAAGAVSMTGDVEFHAGDACDLSFQGDGTVDLVFTSNLLEHLSGREQVERMLREVFRVLRPGGHMLAMGPNLRFLHGAYWDFWDHIVPLTDRSLAEALELTGFRVLDRIARFLPYTTVSRIPQRPWMVRAYLWCRPAWAIMGRQFLLRAQKPTG